MMYSTIVVFKLSIIGLFIYLNAPPALSFGLQLPDVATLRSCKIDKIYQLGDSFADTGNHMLEDASDVCSIVPYGESCLQGQPTGRCSDGLLTIDYIALAAGIPFLDPYLKGNANFTHGVNFAVGGATALSGSVLAEKNISLIGTNSSLDIQLEWMSNYLASVCNKDTSCSRKHLKNALLIVGLIGSNDYNFASIEGRTIEEAQNLVPEVVEAIKDAVRRVIGLGAARIIVPGNFPTGCFPSYLILHKSNNESAYDEHQCLKEYNNLAVYHNDYLQEAVITLQEENPAITIVYADYYNAFKWLLHNAPHLGFDALTELEGCCGNGPSSRASMDTEGCGKPSVPVCSNPDRYINWDGLHLTQKAYRLLTKWLLADIVPKLNCEVVHLALE